jgi:hypothetical protein
MSVPALKVRQVWAFRPFRAGWFIASFQKLRIWQWSFGGFAAMNKSFDTGSKAGGNS